MANLSGEELVLIANAIAILIAQDRTTDEMFLISSILIATAANMNLIANQRDLAAGKSTPQQGAF